MWGVVRVQIPFCSWPITCLRVCLQVLKTGRRSECLWIGRRSSSRSEWAHHKLITHHWFNKDVIQRIWDRCLCVNCLRLALRFRRVPSSGETELIFTLMSWSLSLRLYWAARSGHRDYMRPSISRWVLLRLTCCSSLFVKEIARKNWDRFLGLGIRHVFNAVKSLVDPSWSPVGSEDPSLWERYRAGQWLRAGRSLHPRQDQNPQVRHFHVYIWEMFEFILITSLILTFWRLDRSKLSLTHWWHLFCNS